MHKWLLGVCSVLTVFTVSACANYPDHHVNTTNTSSSAATVQNALQTAPARITTVDNTHRLHAEKRIADRVIKTGSVQQASVLVLGDTAYIGVVQKPGVHGDMSAVEKSHLSEIVKQFDPRIKMVYISANPDVYSHFQNFATDIAQGRPVSGIWNSFRSMVTRIWPTAR